MSSTELTLFSYEILGLVGRGGAGAHDLLRMAQRGRILDWAGESQYYVEPKRLAKLGYLEARRSQAGPASAPSTRSQRRASRRSRLRGTPVRFTPLKSEPLLRLLICDLVGEDVHPRRASQPCATTSPTSAADSKTPSAPPRPAPPEEVSPARNRLPPRPPRPARAAGRGGRARVPPLPAGRGQLLRTRRPAGLDAGNSLMPAE